MPEDSGQEKTEDATPKKREKAREEGQVAKSMEIPSVAVILTATSILYLFGEYMYHQLEGMMRFYLTFDKVPDFTAVYCSHLFVHLSLIIMRIMLPLLGLIFLMALITNFVQVGFHLSTKALEPKFSRIDFISGMGRLFSIKSLGELVKSILKLTIIGVVTYFIVKHELGTLWSLHETSIAYILLYVSKIIMKIFIWVILIMVLVAVADYAFQKWQFEKQLRMSKQEVKEEHKEMEGDPHIKARIRSIQIQAARRRMMQEVPKADVVVTNPTHLAVALKYDALSMGAPKVLAKGADLVAYKIREIALEHQIPVVEDQPLARNLYKMVDIDQEVPTELYTAVAELLAYVFNLKKKR